MEKLQMIFYGSRWMFHLHLLFFFSCVNESRAPVWIGAMQTQHTLSVSYWYSTYRTLFTFSCSMICLQIGAAERCVKLNIN